MIEVHEDHQFSADEDEARGHAGGRPKVNTSQKPFRRPKRAKPQPFKSKFSGKSSKSQKRSNSRPQSAPMRRRNASKGRPASASRLRSSTKAGGGDVNTSLEAQNRAREITKMRIAALEGSGRGTNSVQNEINKRQNRLREQLEKSHSKSRQRHREIESHLRVVRSAMEKEVRASMRNNRRVERQERRQESANVDVEEIADVRHLATVSGSRRSFTPRSPSQEQPLHKQPYMDGILREEQEKLMTKVRRLVITEVSQPPSDMDPTVLAPVLKSALIKYARQGNLDAVSTLLESGVDPDVRLVEEPRRTLLQEAGRTGRVALAELLVSHGASIAAKDSDGLNVLYHCYNEGHGGLAERLVAMSARSLRK